MIPLSSKMPDKVPINLTKYPAIKELSMEEAGPLVSSTFKILDQAVASGYNKVSKEYFGMELQDLLAQLIEGIFDYNGMMEFLPNKSNGAALADMYEHALNPLHAAFTKKDLLNHEGEKVSFQEKFGMKEGEFTVKKWLQGLLFYSYYCSLPDLAQYLALNDYSLVDEEKHENIAKLIEIRPVLDYQKRIGILPGKLIPETGFFEAGDLKEGETVCPACQMDDQLIKVTNSLVICCHCKAGYNV